MTTNSSQRLLVINTSRANYIPFRYVLGCWCIDCHAWADRTARSCLNVSTKELIHSLFKVQFEPSYVIQTGAHFRVTHNKTSGRYSETLGTEERKRQNWTPQKNIQTSETYYGSTVKGPKGGWKAWQSQVQLSWLQAYWFSVVLECIMIDFWLCVMIDLWVKFQSLQQAAGPFKRRKYLEGSDQLDGFQMNVRHG